MGKVLNTVRRIQGALEKLTKCKAYICAVLLLIMTAITFVQVLMRYVFASPIIGAEEATLLLLVWFGFLCMSLDIHTDSHAALYFIYNRLPAVLKKVMDLMRHGLLSWLFFAMVRYGMRITEITMPQNMAATGVSQGLLFLPLVIGGAFMFLYSILHFLNALLCPLEDYRPKKKDGDDVISDIDALSKERGGTV